MTTFTNSVRTLGLAFAMLVLVALPLASARAADLDGWYSGGDYYDYGYDTGGWYSGGDYYDYGYDTGWYSGGDSYDYGYDYYDYGSYDYTTPSYTSYDYYTPTSFSGSTYYPQNSYVPYVAPSYTPPASTYNTNVNDNTTTNTNTNTNTNTQNQTQTNNQVVTVNVPQGQTQTVYQPVYQPVYQQPTCNYCGCAGYTCPTYDVCPNIPGVQTTVPSGYYVQNGYCYQNVYPTYSQPSPAPYVTLSAVPYTGLELGPMGTALYWSFLVLWCLAMAYLIVVKRVQNKIVSGLNNMFFGSTPLTAGGSTSLTAGGSAGHAPASKSHAAHGHSAHAHAPAKERIAGTENIDPFIASQINR